MSSSHHIGTQGERFFEKCLKFYLTVTEDVRVGGVALLKLFEEVGKDSIPVLFGQINCVVRDVQCVAHARHVVIVGLAVAKPLVCGLFPILHEEANDVMPLLLEEEG